MCTLATHLSVNIPWFVVQIQDRRRDFRFILSESGIYRAYDLFSVGVVRRATQLYMARKILRGVRVSFLQCVALEVWASDEGVWGLGLGIPPERDK